MDFMKVFDQTVREIKREVNLKVLKVPEIEQKVLDATSSEPWGPHGSALSEIAQATKKFSECQMIMNVLWTRLKEAGSNWRHVYKALTVVEYLVANGSERALDDILEHNFQISSLSGFEYVEANGKDVGINVRKKVETILAFLNDKEKIKAVRVKAAANRDKYVGLSSTGITFKSNSKSYDSYCSHHSNYGSRGSSREGESFRDGYKDSEDEEKNDENFDRKNGRNKSEVSLGRKEQSKQKKGADSYEGVEGTKQAEGHSSSKVENAEDDFDDFDPRSSSTIALAEANNNQANLFGESLLIDLMDAPASLPVDTASTNVPTSHEDDLFADANFVSGSIAKEPTVSVPVKASEPVNDLFADATFVSASSRSETTEHSHSQDNIDLFADQPAFPVADTPVGFFTGNTPDLPHETKSQEPSVTNSFDPFAGFPLSNFGGSDLFGDFTSHTNSAVEEHPQISANNQTGIHPCSTTAAKPTPKKDVFQVKSGIWTDSLSRGLIDLNITAPKKTSLAELGIVGDISDGSSAKGYSYSAYTGRNTGAGSRLNRPGISSSTIPGSRSSSTFGQEQFGSFR